MTSEDDFVSKLVASIELLFKVFPAPTHAQALATSSDQLAQVLDKFLVRKVDYQTVAADLAVVTVDLLLVARAYGFNEYAVELQKYTDALIQAHSTITDRSLYKDLPSNAEQEAELGKHRTGKLRGGRPFAAYLNRGVQPSPPDEPQSASRMDGKADQSDTAVEPPAPKHCDGDCDNDWCTAKKR
jgi:hypothetical protein